jgi:hypothetical protein
MFLQRVISFAKDLGSKVIDICNMDIFNNDNPPCPFDDVESEKMWRASKRAHERDERGQAVVNQQVKKWQRWTSQKLKKPRPQGRGFLLRG